jgi:hypothetical protein
VVKSSRSNKTDCRSGKESIITWRTYTDSM